MTAELLVNVTPSETRVAYIDGGILQEIHIEREARRGIVGNIYKGRVSRVLPGMQAAFVDIAYYSASRFTLNMNFLKNATINVGHTGFRWRYVYQQFSRHNYPFPHAVS